MLPLIVLLPVLVWVTVSDLLWRRIGNGLVLGLLLVFMLGLARLVLVDAPPSAWSEVAFGTGCAAVVMLVGFGLFCAGWMGAGDVKLMAVLCLWLGGDAMVFLFLTALLGGALALAMPLVTHLERLLALAALRLSQALPRLLIPVPGELAGSSAAGLPYGVAIATAAGGLVLARVGGLA